MGSKRTPRQENRPADSAASELSRFKHGQRAYHGRMRRQQHSAAQRRHEEQTRPPVPRHPLIPAGAPQWVQSPAELGETVAHVRQSGSFAYDTEFIGELTYYPRLCMIQLATAERVILVDPLAELDLRPLWEAIGDADVLTIVHAGQQDLEPVARLLGRPPSSVVDAQVAAGFAGLPYPLSLRELVRELAGAEVIKSATFTEWDRRPLAPMQLEYAADDVRYLPAAWARLREQLERRGHLEWALAECDALCRMETYAFDLDAQVGRVKGVGALSDRRWAVLRELVRVRDQAARQQDVPARALLRDEVLIALAKRQPVGQAELQAISGLPRPVERAYGEQLLAAIRAGQQAPAPELARPRRPSEPPAERIAVDSLWALTQSLCHSQAIDPALVATRQEIRQFLADAESPGRTDGQGLTRGWRGQLVGRFLKEFLAGRAELPLRWTAGRLTGGA